MVFYFFEGNVLFSFGNFIISLTAEDSHVIVEDLMTDASFFISFFFSTANFVLLPFSYLISSSSEGSKSPLADSSLHVLLVLIHYHKCVVSKDSTGDDNNKSAASDALHKEITYFSVNPYCKALEHATDFECNILILFPFIYFG